MGLNRFKPVIMYRPALCRHLVTQIGSPMQYACLVMSVHAMCANNFSALAHIWKANFTRIVKFQIFIIFVSFLFL